MSAPRSERHYRVSRGWLVEPPASIPVVRVKSKLNHATLRRLRLASQRANKHTANRRGVKKHQRIMEFVGVGPVGKSLDRLQEFAQHFLSEAA